MEREERRFNLFQFLGSFDDYAGVRENIEFIFTWSELPSSRHLSLIPNSCSCWPVGTASSIRLSSFIPVTKLIFLLRETFQVVSINEEFIKFRTL